jgi:hypothetical protein
MHRYEDTDDPNNPPQAVLHLKARSAALTGFLGSLIVFFVLVAAALVFWTVAHPRPAGREGMERVVGTSGYYSTEGGHDPVRRPGSTRDELKFRGQLTPPNEARGR